MGHVKTKNRFFIILLVVLSILFLYVIRGYLYPIFWALVFTIMLSPLVSVFQKTLKVKKGVATILVILSFLVIFIVTVFVAGQAFISESSQIQQTYFAESSSEGIVSEINQAANKVENTLGIGEGFIFEKSQNIISEASNFLTTQILEIGQNVASFAFSLFISLYIAYFFIVYNEKLQKRLIRLLPFGDSRKKN